MRAAGVAAAAAALAKGADKLQVLRTKKKAQNVGVGDEHLDLKK